MPLCDEDRDRSAWGRRNPQCSCVPTMVFRGLLTQVAARGRGEHQVLGILTFALLFDGFHYLLWNGNVPYLPCFRSSLKMFSARTHPTQAHLKPVVLDVHMLDAQCSCLAPSKAAEAQCQDQSSVIAGRIGKAKDLCGCEICAVFPLFPWKLASICWIAAYAAISDCKV